MNLLCEVGSKGGQEKESQLCDVHLLLLQRCTWQLCVHSPSSLKRAEQDGEVTTGSAGLPQLETFGQDMSCQSDDIGSGGGVVVGAHLVCVFVRFAREIWCLRSP